MQLAAALIYKAWKECKELTGHDDGRSLLLLEPLKEKKQCKELEESISTLTG